MTILINRFHIIKRLGAGTFGETFLAEDLQKMNEPCVVKRLIVPTDTTIVAKVRQMFELEAKKLLLLNHPGIPKLSAYFEDGGQFYLVQEFIDGHTLDEEINPSQQWTETQVRDFLIEVLEILAYVHSQGSIHRDLKPNNLMRRHINNELVLIDFGAVREVRQTSSNIAIGLASGTITVGTPGYMPAEQTLGKPCYASDVYAVGCIAIEALIGESPCPDGFEIDVNTGEILWRHQTQVSDSLAAIIDKMVRYDWRQRYANATEALAALQLLQQNQTLSLSSRQSHPTELSNPTPQPHNSKRRRFITLIGGAGIVALGIVLVKWLQGEPKPPKPQAQVFSNFTETLANGVPLEMLAIPSGTFWMGSTEEEQQQALAAVSDSLKESYRKWMSQENPRHQVSLDKFYLSKYEVTQEQWLAVMGDFKHQPGFRGNKRPIERISWHDAQEFCQKLSQQTGKQYRLPSEAEWEYACRAGTQTPFYFGNTITTNQVNFDGNNPFSNAPKGKYRAETTDVGFFPPNKFGLYDMHGNVWEWCKDAWHDDYNGAPTDGKAWLSGGNSTLRVLRGGAWNLDLYSCRVANRYREDASDKSNSIGFRVAVAYPTNV